MRIIAGSSKALVLETAKALRQPFGMTTLVLSCWRRNPETFGLEGAHEHHPSDTKIRNALYGRNGLICLGHIIRTDGGYRVVNNVYQGDE